MPDVAVVLGTYNRWPLLARAIESIRRSCGALSYVIIVVDGGSDDGTREWLADQEHVIPIYQGRLLGAVKAFNAGFALATIIGSPWVVILNDDDELIGPEPEIERCVEWMRTDESIGGITFESDLRGKWACEKWRDKSYVNKGIVRSDAGMAAARAMGDPTGREWWGHDHHTYAADTEMGLWIWKLGWRVVEGKGWRVKDNAAGGGDEMRKRNVAEYIKSGTAKLFTTRWQAKDAADYDADAARAFGGRVHE